MARLPPRALGVVRAGTLAVAAMAIAVGPLGTSASARPAAPVQGAAAPTITLVEQTLTVGADGVFGAQVDVEGAPAGSDLAVDIYGRADSAEALAAAAVRDPEATFLPVVALADEETATPQRSGFLIGLYRPDEDRPPGLDYTFALDRAGVYPIRIRLRGPEGEPLTTLLTSILRLPGPGESVTPAEVALVTTVHADPPGDATSRAATDAVDGDLVNAVGPVLDALDEHPALPVTFDVTPDTAARLDMDPDANDTRNALRAQLRRRDHDLLDAPYVDVDPANLVAAGLATELSRQRDLGRRTLRDTLATPEPGTWALHRPIDLAGLAALRSRGISRVLLPPSAVTAGSDQGRSTIATADGDVTALVASAELSTDSAGGPVLAAHQLFARLTVAATAGPTSSVLAIDPQTADATTLGLVLAGLDEGSDLFRAATLDGLFETGPQVPAPTLAAPEREALGTYPAEVTEAHADLVSYASLVGDRPDLLDPFERPLALSAAVDVPLVERRRDLAGVHDQLDAAFAAIALPDLDQVTLGARRAIFPVTITSTLDYPVRVQVDLESNDRLDFPDSGDTYALKNERTTVSVPVITNAPGDTPLRVVVRTPDGRRVLAEGRSSVRSTAVSGLGLLLTIGAGAFLALWWGRHWHRNRTVPRHARGRRTRPAPAGDPDAVDALGADHEPSV